MAEKLSPGATLVRTDPVIELEGLPEGRFRIELMVVDESGLASAPALLTIDVRAS